MTDVESAYADFRQSLRRFIARRVRHADDVDDVLQEVFVRVTRNRDALARAGEPLAWLHAVARSAVVDHHRRNARRPVLDTDCTPEDLPDASEPAPSEDFADCLLPLVNALPDKYRDTLLFVDMQGGRQTDLARKHGVAVSTAKSWVQRARRHMRAAILACCRVDRDAAQRVTALSRQGCAQDCC